MRAITAHLYGLLLVLAFTPIAAANEGVSWMSDPNRAMQIARNTNRLVLLHFYGTTCPPCRQMDKEVFPRQDVARAVHEHYVPVKLNSAEHQNLVRQFGIEKVPCDVILHPGGRVINKFTGGRTAADYMTRIRQVAVAHPVRGEQIRMAASSATPPAAPAYGTDNPGLASARPSESAVAAQPASMTQRTPATDSLSGQSTYGYGAPAAQAPPSAGPANPPLGLDGFCPVTLTENEAWNYGDPRWGVRHEGRTYLFRGPEEQQRFLQTPERYAPVAAGHDIVLLLDQRQQVAGSRHFGVWCNDRVYLFASRETSAAFKAAPEQYVSRWQASQAGSRGSAHRQAAPHGTYY